MKDWFLGYVHDNYEFSVIRRYTEDDEETLHGSSRLYRGNKNGHKVYGTIIGVGNIEGHTNVSLVNESQLLQNEFDRMYFTEIVSAIKLFKLKEQLTNFLEV